MVRAGPPVAGTDAQKVSDNAVARIVTAATFQFLNPKSWVPILSAIAVAHADADAVFLEVGALLIIIPTICLTLWSVLGVILMRFLSQELQRRRFDRGMGILLILSATSMLRSL
jgi:threonine/homoserine/homoserine lactone efflux protein